MISATTNKSMGRAWLDEMVDQDPLTHLTNKFEISWKLGFDYEAAIAVCERIIFFCDVSLTETVKRLIFSCVKPEEVGSIGDIGHIAISQNYLYVTFQRNVSDEDSLDVSSSIMKMISNSLIHITVFDSIISTFYMGRHNIPGSLLCLTLSQEYLNQMRPIKNLHTFEIGNVINGLSASLINRCESRGHKNISIFLSLRKASLSTESVTAYFSILPFLKINVPEELLETILKKQRCQDSYILRTELMYT
jgi:hypothetical protein